MQIQIENSRIQGLRKGEILSNSARVSFCRQYGKENFMKYFGTDGFRGKANETLTLDHALKIQS